MKALSPANEIEALSAFVDGRLGPEDHAAVVARLAEDERYFELLSEVLAFREVELENEAVLPADLMPVASPPGTLERIRLFWSMLWHARPVAILIPVAATLVLTLSWWFWSLAPLSSEELLTRVRPAAGIVAAEDFGAPWRVYRSGEPQSRFFSIADTRSGVRIVDLHQALAIRHAPAAAAAFFDLGISCEPCPPIPKELREKEGFDWTLAETTLAQIEASVVEIADPESYRAAVLLRTAWFAARNGDRQFFDGKVERELARLGIESKVDLAGLVEKLEEVLRERADPDPN